MFSTKLFHHFTRLVVALLGLLLALAISRSISFTYTAQAISPDGIWSAPGEPLPPSPHQIYLPLLTMGASAVNTTSTTQLATPVLINQAFANGEITADERVLYLAYALYEPQLLPLQFHSNVGWYGTQYVVEVQNFIQGLSASSTDAVQQELSRLGTLAVTVCDTEDGPNVFNSTNFHFNYDTILGGLAIADYVTSMEATFDIEVSQFGWAEPPLNANNPFGRYPIQIFALGGGLYGYVSGGGGGDYTGFIGDNPNTPATETDALSSCMVLNNNFDQFPEPTAQAALDATTSHEFVHAIQNGYGDPGTREDAMWYESGAAYMEDEIFDNANSDYSYLWPEVENCLGQWPNNGAPGGISQYSNFLFFRHVAEHNGGTNVAGGGEDVTQHFWENVAAGQDALIAYNNALVTEGTNLPDAFHKYAIAAKFEKGCSGGYDGDYCFEEGPDYVAFMGDLPPVHGTIAANPGTYNGSIKNHYATNWITLPTVGSPYKVTLSNTAAGGQLRGSLVCDTGSALTITPFAAVVGAGNATVINSFTASGCNSVVAVITNQQQISGNPASCASHGYTVAVSAADVTPTPTVTDTPTNTPIAPTATATNTPTNTPIAPTATATNTPTNTPIAPTATATNTPTNTPIAPTATATNTPTNTPIAPTATATNTPTNTPVGPTPTATPLTGNKLVYLSSGNGRVDTLLYRDEDIILYDETTNQWTMLFDGSDVGVANANLDAFDLLGDGTILMSFDKRMQFPTLGLVDDSDIVKFTPIQLGLNTIGSFTLFFDGSDVELTTEGEDIDAIDYTSDGQLLISTYGTAQVGALRALDEDLLRFTSTALGATTAGSWALYFDGSAVALTAADEDIGAVETDGAGNLYLVTKGKFKAVSQNTVAGDSDDIFSCSLGATGLNSTICTFSAIFDGDLARFNHPIDGLSLGATVLSAATPAGNGLAVDEPAQFEVFADEAVLDDEEFDRFDTEQTAAQIFLPLIVR